MDTNSCALPFQSNYPRYLTVVEKEKKNGDTLQYECRQYTIKKPGIIVICSKDKIMLVDRYDNPIEVIQKYEDKVYRECILEQQSDWEKYNEPAQSMVQGAAKPLVSIDA